MQALLDAIEDQEFDYDMKLRDEDKRWLRQEIADVVKEQNASITSSIHGLRDEFRPHGAKKFFFWLREWGLVATNITIILTLLGLLLAAVYTVVHRVSAEATFEANTSDHLKSIDNSLSSLRSSLSGTQLSSLSTRPINSETPVQVSRIISSATKAHETLGPDVIADAAAGFLQSASINPAAWKATSLLLDYKSTLNSALAPSTVSAQPYMNVEAEFTGNEPWIGRLAFIGRVHGDRIAQLEELDHPHQANSPNVGPAYYVLNGGEFDLDGLYLKNVIVKDALVVYRGGPVRIENTFFVDCHFRMEATPKTIRFAGAALAPESTVTFSGE